MSRFDGGVRLRGRGDGRMSGNCCKHMSRFDGGVCLSGGGAMAACLVIVANTCPGLMEVCKHMSRLDIPASFKGTAHLYLGAMVGR